MKKTLRSFLMFVLPFVTGTALHAQITGTVTVPSATYPTLASIVTALNTQGVGTGGAIVNITAGNNQTAPAGGYQLGSTALNASLSATKTLTINGNGNVVTAPAGTKGIVGGGDGIFWLMGTDYVTIDGLNLAESATNTDTTLAMEYGYMMVNLNSAAPFDGCNRNTIKNCSITLQRTIATPTIAIYAAHRTYASSALLAITAVGDQSSYNKFYGNTITNTVTGIRLDGINDVTPFALYDRGNDVGGTSTATGNTITNFGGTNYTSIGGITMVYQDSANVSYNTLNDTANGGVGAVGGIWGIYVFGTNSNFTTNNNNIVMASAGINTTYFIYGIYTNALGTNLVANNNNMFLSQTAGSAGVSIYGVYNPNGNNHTTTANTITINKIISAGTVSPIYTTTVGDVSIQNNNIKIIHPTGTAITGTTYGIYSTGAALTYNINGNVFDNITTNNTSAFYMIYASSSTPVVNINNNKINGGLTRSASGTTYLIYNAGSPTSGTSTINGNNFSNINTSGTASLYGIYYSPTHNIVVTNDTLTNWSMGTASALMYVVYVSGGVTNNVSNNVLTNLATGYTSTVYGIYATTGTTGTGIVANNRINGLNNAGSPNYAMYITGANTGLVYGNNISNISTTTSTSGTAYGMYITGVTEARAYNNFISDIKTPSSSGTSPVYGIYANSGTTISLYHNTVNLTPTSTGTNFGATGIYYASGVTSVDLRNNIVRVVATPAGTGTVVGIRRSTGTAGVAPANLSLSTNGNIIYTPTATNTYLYGEATSTTMVNGFNLTNDAGFNTSCGLYKTFMSPRESNTYTENNLTQIGTTPTFAPSGTSYAESGAVAVTPAITVDYNGVTRSTPADIGALQFAGTATGDAAPPVISYTALPATTICTSPPSLVVNITDVTGVNNTAGTAPRLYYKKSTDANAFGVANTSAGNGWKWVEVTTPTAGNYTFVFDYSKLQSAVAVGDSINYFVIAQDTRPTPNVGANIVGFPTGYCPASVDLPAGAGPLAAAPKPNGYKILAPGTYTATASVKSICISGATVLTLSPAPVGATIQWQQDNNTATYTDIAGANTASYTLPTVTASSRYRAQIKCGTTVIATSTSDTVVVSSPQVTSTTPASRCGVGTLTLGAAGTNLKWYDVPTGGNSIGSGTSFTTPSISTTTTYYVTASSGGGLTTVGPASPTAQGGAISASNYAIGTYYMSFDVIAPTTLQSIDVFPTAAVGTAAAIEVRNSAGTTLISVPYTTTVTGGATAQTVTLNLPLAIGTGYRIGQGGTAINLNRNTSGSTYPYTSPVANITGNNFDVTYWYYIYNWKFQTGCESNRVPVVATIGAAPPITVNAAPAAICPGSSSTVSVTSPNAGYSYSWSNGQTVASFSVTPAATTKYVVTATDAVTSCVNKDSVTVTVVNQTATITPSATQTICTGNSVTLSANTGTGLSYEWFNGTTSTGVTTATYSATTAGAYTVKVTHTASGCSATSAPVTVNVVAPPISTITPGGNLTLCSGSTLTLNGPTGTGYTYQWKLGSANATGTSTAVSYNATAAGTYTLVVTANGCSTTSAPSTITILPLPLATMSPSAPATACDSVVLSSSNTNVTYQWNYNTQPILGANAATYGAPVSGNYSLTTTSTINGCSATSAPVAITINQSPAATITYASPITFCQGSAVVLNTYSGANLVYEWRDGNVAIPGATANTYTTSSTGSYSVRVLNAANGCARVSQVVNVKVNPLPSPVITYNSGTNTLTTTLPYAQYQWVLNSQHIGGATQRNYRPQQSGAYLVIVTDTNGCMNQSEIQFVNNVGVVTTNVGKAITIYPNPASGVLYVKSSADVNLSLRDITGKTVLTGTDKTSLNLANLADGMYMLFITDKSGQLVRAEKITKSTN